MMKCGALPPDIPAQVARALAEDIGSGDVTAALVPAGNASATLITRDPMVLCGTAWVDEVFRQLDPAVSVSWRAQDGTSLAANSVLCEITGPARAILSGERCALNFLQTLSWGSHDHQPVCRRNQRHQLPHPRHPQDHSRTASGPEICSALRRGAAITAWACTTWC